MQIAWSDVAAIAPELADPAVSEAAQEIYLGIANAEFAPSVFGGEASPKLKLARIYLAAHMATVGRGGGAAAAGPVVKESTGRISREYADVSSGSSAWSGSSYGDELTRLIRTTRARLPRTF